MRATAVALISILLLAGCSAALPVHCGTTVIRAEAPSRVIPAAPTETAVDADVAVEQFNDCHLHTRNYVQHGITIAQYLDLVGDRVGRAALFGLPLQQKWDHFVSGDRAPDYYLLSDAALYYYSFIDAVIAQEYLGLTDEQKARVDPLLCGFNPTDMYAPEHIERVLLTYPGVFSGIGEFSVHKEFVSSKISGHTASLRNQALHAVFDKAEEIGLVILLHCDVDTVRSAGPRTAHFDDLVGVFRAHPGATIIWAHTGLGRYVKPTELHVSLLTELLEDPRCDHVVMDLAWDEIAKWITSEDDTLDAWVAMIERHPHRFLLGTDSVAPEDWNGYAKTYVAYEKLWKRLKPDTQRKIKRSNYARVFDAAVPRIRAWERARRGSESMP